MPKNPDLIWDSRKIWGPFVFYFYLYRSWTREPGLGRTLAICGVADRSGRGKRSSSSSSSSSCCWGGTFFSLPCTVFWGVKRQKLCLKRGVKRQKLCLKILFSTPQIRESIPFLFVSERGGKGKRDFELFLEPRASKDAQHSSNR